MTKQYPLLAVGTFGVHINLNPAKTYSFVGEVPASLYGFRGTYEECYAAFANWFKNLPVETKREFAPNLRNDVFVDFANSGIFS